MVFIKYTKTFKLFINIVIKKILIFKCNITDYVKKIE